MTKLTPKEVEYLIKAKEPEGCYGKPPKKLVDNCLVQSFFVTKQSKFWKTTEEGMKALLADFWKDPANARFKTKSSSG